jgi:type II secretory pathway component PulF
LRARLPRCSAFLCSRLSLSHAKLSAFYLQLSQQLGAGLTLLQSLGAPSPAPAADCARLAGMIRSGSPAADVFAAAGNWLPQEDRPFLAAAAETGRLPLILKTLADRHAHLGTLKGRVLFTCLYPLGVMHFGSLVFAMFRLINWETGIHWSAPRFFGGVAMILLPFWISGIVLTTGIKRRNPLAIGLLNLLPAIGGYRREQALSDFAFSLGHLLEAGAPIADAWRSAGKIANSPRIEAAAESIRAQILLRAAPGALLPAHRVFPHDFISLYQTGEATGSLDKNLLHLAQVHQERAHQKLSFAAYLYPGLLFFAVAGLVMFIVIKAYAGYVGNIEHMLNGM